MFLLIQLVARKFPSKIKPFILDIIFHESTRTTFQKTINTEEYTSKYRKS